jgi:hypothetical protein
MMSVMRPNRSIGLALLHHMSYFQQRSTITEEELSNVVDSVLGPIPAGLFSTSTPTGSRQDADR